jgi:hypothetical protein
MKRLKFVACLLPLLFVIPSYAAHCPMDMKKIDAAISAGTKLSEAELTEVKKLRMDGEELHKAGKHDEAVDALGKAMKMLGVN